MELGAATHPGYVRPENEDGFFASRDLAVFAVADGMGGHEHGEVASHLALETIAKHANTIAQAQPTDLPAQLHRTIQDANTAIFSEAATQDARSRMGTTVVVATVHGDRLYFAHIGDSRLYLLRGDLFTQLTRDHSLVQTMIDRGELTPDEAAIHPLRHQITRVVGGDDYISPEIASQALEPGDIILLCTDGLCGVVPQETIFAILHSENTCQQKADALVQAALKTGGPDNVTVVVTAYARPRPTPDAPEHRSHLALWPTIGILLLFMLVCVLGFSAWSYKHPKYLIAVDSRENVRLYQHWVGLPMLGKKRLPDPLGMAVPLAEVKPYLNNNDVGNGVPVPERSTGEEFIKRLVNDANTQLLAQAKSKIEAGDIPGARALINRAKALRAAPRLVTPLETMLTKAEATRKK